MTILQKGFLFGFLVVNIVFSITTILAVIGVYSKIERHSMASFAYGYEEKENVWHRIRVDAEGKVNCSKGGQ